MAASASRRCLPAYHGTTFERGEVGGLSWKPYGHGSYVRFVSSFQAYDEFGGLMHKRTAKHFTPEKTTNIEAKLTEDFPPAEYQFDITVTKDGVFVVIHFSNGVDAGETYMPDGHVNETYEEQISRLVRELIEKTKKE
ncbi:MAG: hypothetical protein ABSF98_13395 [Bryobacteraceae bacterium]